MRQLFFAAFDQSQRASVVFAARLGYLRAGARVVSHEALKPFTQILAIGRVLSTRLSAIRSAPAQWRPMHARMADGILRWEGREIGCRGAGEINAETLHLVRLLSNTTQRRGSLWLDFLARAKVRACGAESRVLTIRSLRYSRPPMRGLALAGTSPEGTTHPAKISPDRLVCRAYGAQTLERRSVKIRRSQPAFRQRQRPRCSRRITCVPWTGRS